MSTDIDVRDGGSIRKPALGQWSGQSTPSGPEGGAGIGMGLADSCREFKVVNEGDGERTAQLEPAPENAFWQVLGSQWAGVVSHCLEAKKHVLVLTPEQIASLGKERASGDAGASWWSRGFAKEKDPERYRRSQKGTSFMSYGRRHLWGFNLSKRTISPILRANPIPPFRKSTIRPIQQALWYRGFSNRLFSKSQDLNLSTSTLSLGSNISRNPHISTSIIREMHSSIQFITTPTSDTAGTALLLDVDQKRYLFGNIHEGLQRACIQRGARLARTADVFISGKTNWRTHGGLFGLILTLADANASALQSENENAQNKKTDFTDKQTLAKAGRKAKLEEERARVFREAGLDSDNPLNAPENGDKSQVPTSSLTIHGGKNLTHTIATGRRFIFRKGMAIDVDEYQNQDYKLTAEGRDPDWTDDSIQVWKLSVEPSEDNQPPDISPESHRKRSLDEFIQSGDTFPPNEEASEPSTNADELRRTVVSNMFCSQWRLDALFETPLSQVQRTTPMWIRSKETNKIERYTPPETESLPDINILIRHPWPGALVDELPPTRPSEAALSYIVRHYPQKGKFNPQKAKALNVHHFVFQALQRGLTVKSQDGITVTSDMVLEPSRTGGGFAIIDIPKRGYVRTLLSRPEWKMPRIMDGLQAIVWNLGDGVAEDPVLKSFITQHTTLKHIVSSPGISPNYLTFDSASALLIRLNQLDSQRYTVPIHSNVPLLPSSPIFSSNGDLSGPQIASRQLRIQLEPYLKIEQVPDAHRYLDIQEVPEGIPKDILGLAQDTRSSIASDSLAENPSGQGLPSEDAEVICLGTGSSAPSKYRNVSATLLRVPGSGSYLFDCGEGTLGQLKRLYTDAELKSLWLDLKAIWISHLHADHHLGTTSVIKAWHRSVHGSETLRGEILPLDKQTSDPIETLLKEKMLVVFAGHHMVDWLKEYSSVENFGYEKVVAIRTFPVSKNTGCRLEFQGMTNLVTCGVAHCHDAQAVSVTFPTGFKFSYSGDCRPSSEFVRIGQGSTVLVHEATFDDDMQGDAEAKKHSTMSEAIGVAQAMGAKRLILTHFSQRYQKIPLLGALDKINVKFDNAETASEGDGNIDVVDIPEVLDSATNAIDPSHVRRKPTPPLMRDAHSPHSSDSSPVSLASPQDLKVAIAFDLLRVRVGDIEHLEKFTPVIQRMFEILEEDKAKVKEDPGEIARRNKEEEKEMKRQDHARRKEMKDARTRKWRHLHLEASSEKGDKANKGKRADDARDIREQNELGGAS
ncbi:MAG: hypothetical protein Q9170_006327 [Blastenia crenularia]